MGNTERRSTGALIYDLAEKMAVSYNTADQVLAVVLEDKEFKEVFTKLWNKHQSEIQFILTEFNIERELMAVLGRKGEK